MTVLNASLGYGVVRDPRAILRARRVVCVRDLQISGWRIPEGGFETDYWEDFFSIGNPRSEIRRVISFQIRAAPLRVTAEYATTSLVPKTADARLRLALN